MTGGILLVPPAVGALFFASDGSGPLPTLFVALGFAGALVAPVGVLWLYPLASSEGEAEGGVWASLGLAVTLLGLVGLLVYTGELARDADPGRLYLTASVLALWIRPLGVLFFAFALVRADIVFGRALLLFLVSFLEIPLLSNLAFEATSGAGWAALFFGFPNLYPGQVGLLGALAWMLFGYSFLSLVEEPARKP